MNAVIYARVSTTKQKDEGYSLQSQIEACREYARDHGMSIVAEITDDYTGSTLDRPGFNQVETMLARNEAKAVVVYTSSRLSRHLAKTLLLFEQWKEDGVELHYCDQGKVNFNEEGILQQGVPGLIDHWERIRIRKRTMEGRYNKAKNGRPVNNGNPPFGYRRKGHGKEAQLVKRDRELKIVCDIFEWYIDGTSSSGPLSMREIARKLNRVANVPTPTHGIVWSNIAVHRVLGNAIYTGTLYYGKTKTRMKEIGNGQKKKIIVKVPKEQWISIPVPQLAVIDLQTFEAAEARKERNRELSRRNRKRNYLMNGHFRCGTCGQVMVGYHRQGHLRYQCTTHWKRPGMESCPTSNHSIVCHKVDDIVWDWIYQLLTDDAALEEGLNKMVENNRSQTGNRRKRLDTLEKMIKKRERSIERLLDELNDGAYEDEYTRNIFRQTIKENTDTIKDLMKERDQHEA